MELTELFEGVARPPFAVNQDHVNGIEGRIFQLVCGPEGNMFDIVLHSDFAKQSIRGLLGSRPKGVNKFSFPINWNCPDCVPGLVLELDSDAIRST